MLRLLALGMTTREVSQRLTISAKTADHHIQHLYTKFGVLHPGRRRPVRHRARHPHGRRVKGFKPKSTGSARTLDFGTILNIGDTGVSSHAGLWQ